MQTRIANMAIIVEDQDSVEPINEILHEHAAYVIGRMGVPYRQRQINVISVVLDAPEDIERKLAVKIGALAGVSTEIAYSAQTFNV